MNLDFIVGEAPSLVLPEGEGENSPGRSPHRRTEPWERARSVSAQSRRDDRNLSPHMARVVVYLVLLQKCNELRLEVALTMMLLLPGNVGERGAYLGPSDGERCVAFLPVEVPCRAGCVHPMRGCALDCLHGRGYGQRRRQGQKKRDVVLDSTDAERFHLVPARDAAHVSPQQRLDFRSDGFATIPGGEDAVKQRATVGV